MIIADDDLTIGSMPEVRVDLLVSCGDLADDSILRAAGRCAPKHILAVKGNHDSDAHFPTPIINLHLKTFSYRGITFGGFGGAWKYKPRGHHLYEQIEVESSLKDFPEVNVFVAHNSPAQIHDQDDMVHSGFTAFNSYILRHRPKLFLHGHQHVIKETILGSTRVVGSYGFQQIVLPA